MSQDVIGTVALEIFRRSKRLGGTARPAADQEWRELGSEGRSPWRELAKAAIDVIAPNEASKGSPAETARSTPAEERPKPADRAPQAEAAPDRSKPAAPTAVSVIRKRKLPSASGRY